MKCQFCFEPIVGPYADITFHGFTAAALNGATFTVHAACLRAAPDRGIELAPRLPDPVAEPELVSVDWDTEGWTAECRIHGEVALKDTQDDAHLAAAIHIDRVHAMVA